MFIRYHLVFYGISCLLLIVCLLVHPIFWVLMIGYGIFVIYRLKMINFISIFIFTIIFSFFINWPKPINDTVIKGKIVDLDEKSVVVKTDETKVKVYGNFIGYHLDDELEMEVEYFEINEPTNDNAFNYKNYLYSQGITNNASIKRLLDVNTKETLFQKLQERISSNDLIDSYASMFVLGIKDEVIEDYYQQLTDLSVVHLFALSGLHIHLLKDMLKKVLRFFMPDKYIDYFGIVLIGIYIYLIPFNISFVRAYLVMVLAVLFKRYLNKLDCLSIVTIIMLWTNPYIIFSLSFIFSSGQHPVLSRSFTHGTRSWNTMCTCIVLFPAADLQRTERSENHQITFLSAQKSCGISSRANIWHTLQLFTKRAPLPFHPPAKSSVILTTGRNLKISFMKWTGVLISRRPSTALVMP